MNKKKFEKIFHDTPEAILLTTQSGKVIYSNPAFTKKFGKKLKNYNSTIFDLIHKIYHPDITFFFDHSTVKTTKRKIIAIHHRQYLFPISIIIRGIRHNAEYIFMIMIEDLLAKKKLSQVPDANIQTARSHSGLLFIVDHKLRTLYIDPVYKLQLGYTQNEDLPKNFLDFICPCDYRKILNEFYYYVSGKSIFNSYIYRSVSHDNTLYWTKGCVKSIQNEEGEITGFVINQIIITQQFNKDEDQPLFVQRTDEMLLLLDRNYHIEYISPQCKYLLGYNKEYFPVTYFPEIIHSDDLPLLTEDEGQFLKERIREYEIRIKHKNGQYLRFKANVSVFYDIKGEWENKSVQLLEIPAESEKSVPAETTVPNPSGFLLDQAYNSLFQEIFEKSKNAIFILDDNTLTIVECNQKTLELFEVLYKSDFIGISFPAFQNQYVKNHQINVSQINGNSKIQDIEFVTTKGTNFWGNLSITEIKFKEKWLVIIHVTDVTQRKIHENELFLAKESAEYIIKAQENFLSTISHEIRTPLNSVLGMTHLLLQSNPREDQIKLLQTLKFSGDSLLALIDEILDYSKTEAGKLELENQDFNLKRFIYSIKLTYKNLATSKGLAFRLLTEEEIPEFVKGDVTRLGQILNNLLNNAIKFTEKGQVVLSLYVEQEEENRYLLLFEVSDSGVGIPEDKLDVIFDPFRQASPSTTRYFGGTGLGLAIVKNLVELYGGYISLHSKEGEGTVFKVVLPFQKSEEHEVSATYSDDFIAEYQPLDGLKVLYVEDVLPNQFLMEGLADNWNIKLDTALNGLEALEKVKQNKYDLILMDIQMPEMDGYKATQEIRSLKDPHYANIPIVALSASVSETTRQKIRNIGMDDYISKPINPEDLHRKLAEISKTLGHRASILTNREAQSVTNTADFTDLRNLYGNDLVNYVNIIMQIRDLVKESIPGLIEGLKNHDPEKFSAKRHNIISYIKLFKLNALDQLLETAMRKINNNEMEDAENFADQVQTQIGNLVKDLEGEIQDLQVQ